MRDKIEAELDAIFASDKSVQSALKKIPLTGELVGENFKYMAFYIVKHPEYARDFIEVFKDALVKKRSDVFNLVLIKYSSPEVRQAIRDSGILDMFSAHSKGIHEEDLRKKEASEKPLSDELNKVDNLTMRAFLSRKVLAFSHLGAPSSDDVKAFVEKVNAQMQSKNNNLSYKDFRQILDSSAPQLTSKFDKCQKDFETMAAVKKGRRQATSYSQGVKAPVMGETRKKSNTK